MGSPVLDEFSSSDSHINHKNQPCLTVFVNCDSIRRLVISSNFPDHKDEHVFFPALKSLTLLSVVLNQESYCELLQNSPLLEELCIRNALNYKFQSCCPLFVICDSISRLVISSDYKDAHESVTILAPNLVYLEYSSYVSKQYHVGDMNMLEEARLSLKLGESSKTYDLDVTKLVAGITSITTLHLSPDSLEVLYCCCGSMPMFNNLLNLSIESNKEKGWQVMPLLLKSCPNLHTLIFKGLMHRVTNRCGDVCVCIPEKKEKKMRKIVKELCCLWSCKVKLLEITEFGGCDQELKQMRHFLGNLKCLETVKIDVGVDSDNNISKYLLALPRVSSKCNIQFV